jgi:hypothetical protein
MNLKKLQQHLQSWREANLISVPQASAILAHETAAHKANFFQTNLVGLLGGFSLLLGFIAIIAANWDFIPGSLKLFAHAAISAGLAYGLYRQRDAQGWSREIFVLLLFGTNFTFIALIGQVFQTQAHHFLALLLWLGISTPLVLTQSRTHFTHVIWVMALFAFNWSMVSYLYEASSSFSTSWLAAVALFAVYFAASQFRAFHTALPLAGQVLQRLSLAMLVITVGVLQTVWRGWGTSHGSLLTEHTASVLLIAATLVALIVLSFRRLTVWQPWVALYVFGASLLFGLTATCVDKVDMPAVGAICFILYWLALGFAAFRAGDKELVNMAVWVIALRLFVVYLEVFGTLTLTGIGLMIGGAIFIALGFAARRMQKWLETQHAG